MSTTVEVKLDALCNLVSVQVNPQASPNLPYIGLEHVPPARFCTAVTGLASDAQSSKFSFQPGDVLYGKLRPYLDKAVLADCAGICTTELLVLRPKAGIDPRYVACVVHSPAFIDHAMSGVTGAHHPRTSWNHISQFTLPAHTEDERQVVANLLWQLHELLRNCETACDTAIQLKQTAMSQLFTRGLRGEAQKETEIGLMPESWTPKSVLELCEIWSGGTPRKSVARFWKGDVPWVSGKDLKQPALNDAIDHISPEGVSAGSRLAPEGSVLLLVRGMGLAKDLPVAVISRPMAFNQDVKALVSRGEYSGAFLRSAIYAGKEKLLSQIVPSAHGTMTLNLNDVETFRLACPTDPAEAHEIVSLMTALDEKVNLHQRKRQVLEELLKALLRKLMTGEIDVNDLDLTVLAAEEKGSPV